MTMPGKTVRMEVINPVGEKLTGEEMNIIRGYPIRGDSDRPAPYTRRIMLAFNSCKGLLRHWDCIEKAQRCGKLFSEGRVVIGEFYIKSEEGTGRYRFEFHPPTELHAWLEYRDCIIDLALPGVIEMGRTVEDDKGPILIGNIPFIFAGKDPERYNLTYTKHDYLT